MTARRDPRIGEGQQFTPVLMAPKVVSWSVLFRVRVDNVLVRAVNRRIVEKKTVQN